LQQRDSLWRQRIHFRKPNEIIPQDHQTSSQITQPIELATPKVITMPKQVSRSGA
jgi:hypothetical protein